MLVRVEGEGAVERAVVADVDSDWQVLPGSTRTFEVDAVCLGYGLVPSVELATICGCSLRFATETRSWVPARGADLQSGAPGIYVVGDCAGILGAQAAAVEGRIAGLTVARDLNRLEPARADRLLQPYLERRAELERFGRALHRAFELRPGLTSLAEADTVVCRCEEVTLAEIDEAIDEGAHTPGQLKAWTRAGMGCCQGRMCSSFLMERLASRLERPLEDVGYLKNRAPAKPIVSLESLSR
jgi:NAD(P)H-nitrite reductase large subunit